MPESSASIVNADMPENDNVQSCDASDEGNVFDQYESDLNNYLKHLVDLYMDRLVLYNRGVVGSLDFMPDSLHDVYHSNLYCMSWFYDDVYPFESLEDDIDACLADQMIQDIFEYEYAEYL